MKGAFSVSVLFLLIIASSCSDEESIYGRLSSDELVPAITNGYISVSISANGNYEHTRAAGPTGPMGGEDGNGREDAFENEYQINNLTVLVYSGDISSSDATITKAFYFPYPLGTYVDGESPVQKVYTFTQPIDDLEGIEDNVDYHLIAVCNAGDLSLLEGKKISVVRDHLIFNVCSSERTDFVMSSENDEATVKFDFSESNIVEPSKPIVVERLAARIDFETDKQYNGYYEYDVDGTPGDNFLLRSIQVKNKLTSGTYLIKRVTTDTNINSTIKYLGDETEDATVDGKATNYVLDPWIKGKTSSTMPEELTYESTDFLPVQPVIAGKGYFILDYTMENTLPVDAPLATYATALVFKGDYVASNGEKREGVEYTYYIRHSDPKNAVDAGGEVHCMKYGIVRNTIYRVKITKVNPMDVSTENATLSLQIKVKNWKKTDHVEIVM